MARRHFIFVVVVIVCMALPLEGRENAKARYDNYRVYRVFPANDEQVKLLQQIEEEDIGFSFWKSASRKGKATDIMVPPDKLPNAIHMIKTLDLKHHLMIEDVQRLIDYEHSQQPRTSAGFDWNDYYRLDVIYDWLDELAAKNPNKVTTVIGGQSYEKRQIKGVKYSTGGAGKPVIFVEGGIHANEWISPAVNTYLLNQVVTNQDADVRDTLDYFDWYFFPSINPDGYEYTHTTDRTWRKTRSPGNGTCVGADPNRNWDYKWGMNGSSDNPCSENYHGAGPFSEVEIKTISDFISTVSKDIVVYLSLHSYSQLVLFPMGYTAVHLPDYDKLLSVGESIAQAFANKYGTVFEAGDIVDELYYASGNSIDWVKGVYNISLPYVFELRDTGKYGFLLPPSEIIPSGNETFDALVSLAENARSMHVKKH